MKIDRLIQFFGLLSLFLTVGSLSSCSRESGDAPRSQLAAPVQRTGPTLPRTPTTLLASEDLKELAQGLKSRDKREFMALVQPADFENTLLDIQKRNGQIIFSDPVSGYIHFALAVEALPKLMQRPSLLKVMFNRPVNFDRFRAPHGRTGTAATDNKSSESDIDLLQVLPQELMQTPQLIRYIKERYGVEVNGENSTIAIFDTGLDMTRTDVFQDRIIYLRSIRASERALVALATKVFENGKSYWQATIGDQTVQIEVTPRVAQERPYYVGFFSEQQFKGIKDYNNYDFNQDGKVGGFYPIIVYQNEDGQFEAYINANDKNLYGTRGDQSIEDENLLKDFNDVAATATPAERFVHHPTNPLLSYYRYTTRTDLLQGNGSLTRDRNKGLFNVAITLEPGIELSDDGTTLKPVEGLSSEEAPIFSVGLTGFDLDGHGTHCAGIAAGVYHQGNNFSSRATAAKIVGVSFLGDAHVAQLMDQIIKVAKRFKNPIFSFSFGSSDEENDLQSEAALIYDKIITSYNVPILKAAGNEGPGIKTHGTVASAMTLAVANYQSNNARKEHGSGNFNSNELHPTPSTSNGPMIDGALKPDIGAPGWVLSALPLTRLVGSTGARSYQFYSGTSMATPNAAGVVALLYDAASKIPATTDGRPLKMSVDKLISALKNSALPYSPQRTVKGREGTLQLEERFTRYPWATGGAGRISALGAWKKLEELADRPIRLYQVTTKSFYPGYLPRTGQAAGHFSIDQLVPSVDFVVKINDLQGGLEGANWHEEFRLQIPAEIDWLSFDFKEQQTERTLHLFSNEEASFRVYVRTDKIKDPATGRLRAGLHEALIRAFNIQTPNSFDFIAPITFIGIESSLRLPNSTNFSSIGHIEADFYNRYFFNVEAPGRTYIIDLSVNSVLPGELSMSVVHNGLDVPFKDMEATTAWAISSGEYGEGRNRLRYIFKPQKRGLMEVLLFSDAMATYLHNERPGSFYTLNVSSMGMSVDSIRAIRGLPYYKVELLGAHNQGKLLRVASSTLAHTGYRKRSVLEVEDQAHVKVPITISNTVNALKIETNYFGQGDKIDLDIALYNSQGQMVGASGNPDSNEEILAKNLAPGEYLLDLFGYSVKNSELKDNFTLTISQQLTTPVLWADKFTGPTSELTLTSKFRWPQEGNYNFSALVDAKKFDQKAQGYQDYETLISFEVKAYIGSNLSEQVTLYTQELTVP